MRFTLKSCLTVLAYGYFIVPVLMLPVHAVFLGPAYLVFLLNLLFTGAFLLVPVLTPIPGTLKKQIYLLLNTVAALVLLSVVLTGDLPRPMGLASAMRTDPAEALSLLGAAPLAVGLVACSWLAQLLWIVFGGPAPGLMSSSKRGRFFNAPLIFLALPFLAPDLQLSYPAALPSMAQSAWSYGFSSHATATQPPPMVTPLLPQGNELMVLVVGESSSADYWQLGGSPEPTTPKLIKRKVNGELIYFTKHMSTSSATFVAVPNLLNPEGHVLSGLEKVPPASLISLMKRAGRKTAWLSTQSPQTVSAQAEEVDFRGGNFSFLTMGSLDEQLLSPASSWVAKHTDVPGFLVLHTQGSHYPFELRYPSTFRKWPLSGGAFPSSQNEGNYRNTILYTDHFLDQLMQRLESAGRPVVLAYVSDHGETAMRAGHILREASPLGPEVLHVPLLFWGNRQWRERHPALWSSLQEKADSHIMTSHLNLAPILMHLAGLHYAEEPAELDLLDPEFVPWKQTPAIVPATAVRVSLPAL